MKNEIIKKTKRRLTNGNCKIPCSGILSYEKPCSGLRPLHGFVSATFVARVNAIALLYYLPQTSVT